jgi:hypothetical protein
VKFSTNRSNALCILFVSLLTLGTVAAAQTSDCQGLVAGMLVKDPAESQLEIRSFTSIVDNATCLIESNQSNLIAFKAVQPVRTPLWNAFESFSGSQQGSSLSSSGSTNVVSKPSGPTALVEEFGGINATQGTSSATFQWSPGTMLTNLALNGTTFLCTSPGVPSGCVPTPILKALTPLTVKMTVNTSNGSQTLVGTATTPADTTSAQSITVNTKGQATPSFGGLTVQYSLFGSKNKASVSSLAVQATASPSKATVNFYAKELQLANQTDVSFEACTAYQTWAASASTLLKDTTQPLRDSRAPGVDPDAAEIKLVQGQVEDQYRRVLSDMLASNQVECKTAITNLRALFASILEAETYEDFGAQLTMSQKPELTVEYDLNTPQNKPAYSSAKMTFARSFGSGTKAKVIAPTEADTTVLSSDQQRIRDYAINVTAAKTMSQKAQAAQSLAKSSTAPWSMTINGTAELYNSDPPSSVPSASHLRDIQAAAELSYLFAAPDNSKGLRQLIGNVTAAAAYSYQDQTSPAMLTGPALTDFTNLPSTTKTAYAQRGVIHLGQVRLGFGTGGNTTFPIAFTYSNRSELVVHPTWGLQFGVSYNLTSLFSSSGAK